MKRQSRGMALIMVLILMVVFVILIGGLMDVLAMESRNVVISDSGNTAENAAYAGVDAMVLQTEQWYTGTNPGPAPTSLPTYNFPTDPTGQQVQYSASITKEWRATGLAYFLIDSVGTVTAPCDSPCFAPEIHTREIQALVRQRPFTHYGLFVQSERSNVGGPVWYTYPQDFEGPVYSGGPMHIMYAGGGPSYIFGSTVDTTTGKPPQWMNTNNPGGPQKPQSPSDWAAIMKQGQAAFRSFTTALTLPSFADNLLVASEAYYGNASNTSGLPTVASNGVYVNGNIQPPSTTLQTGIYVQGDADIYSSGSTNGNGTETFEFKPPEQPGGNPIPDDVTIVVNFGAPGSAGTTTVTTSTQSGTVLSTQTYNGVPSGLADPTASDGNGAVFVDGALTVRGSVVANPNTGVGTSTDGPSSVQGQYNIAVPDNINTNSDAITVTNSITYADNGTGSDELALWANDILLTSQVDGGITLDGLILTGYDGELNNDGTFSNSFCRRLGCSGGTGNLTLFGSLVENIRGKLGTVNAGGLVTSGYSRNQKYDARLGANPPPFSPTTNQFEVVALQDAGGILSK